jgi:hypothetical protein
MGVIERDPSPEPDKAQILARTEGMLEEMKRENQRLRVSLFNTGSQ